MRWLAFLALVSSCIDVQPKAQYCTNPAVPEASTRPITYRQDVAPILAARCGSCHAGQGPGPMKLTSWEDAQAFHAAIAAAVQSKRMPPWPPAKCCAEYERPFELTDAELATVLGWEAQGAPEGTAVDGGDPVISRRGLPRVDATPQMSAPYLPDVPEGRTDETRCFVLDWAPEQTVYITGLDIRPGAPAQMHHGLVMVASADDVKQLKKLDDASSADGWPCGGGLVGSFKSSLGGSFYEAQQFADGLGVEMLPTDRIVLQMHYSRPSTGGFTQDLTKVQLMFQREKTEPLVYLSVFNPSWVIGGLYIEANKPDVSFSYADEPTLYNGGNAMLIRAVNIHMHERGSKGQIALLRSDGTRECLLQIDAWNHAWQGDYVLKTPVRLGKGDRVMVECRWDNSASHQRVVNGVAEMPRLLFWGEDQEMCLGFLTASYAP